MTLVHVFNYVETEDMAFKRRVPSAIARAVCKFANRYMGKTLDYDVEI